MSAYIKGQVQTQRFSSMSPAQCWCGTQEMDGQKLSLEAYIKRQERASLLTVSGLGETGKKQGRSDTKTLLSQNLNT